MNSYYLEIAKHKDYIDTDLESLIIFGAYLIILKLI